MILELAGLTVLKEYLKIMPNENYIYYADTKNLPYGNKTKEQIIEYAEHIVEYLIFQNVKAVVIACGTASSLAYEHLKAKYNIPIFDIITPTISSLKSNRIGIMATEASVKSHIWENKIHKENPDTSVFSVACPKLVPLAEKNNFNSISAKFAIKKYLKDLKKGNIDTLILGCTHYPLFRNIIEKELTNDVNIVNIGTASALSFKKFLEENNLNTNANEKGTVTYMASENQEEFLNKKNIIIN